MLALSLMTANLSQISLIKLNRRSARKPVEDGMPSQMKRRKKRRPIRN